MKNWIRLLVLIPAFTFAQEKYKTLAINNSAPKTTVELVATSGATYTLEKLKKDNGLLVIFSCNTCPFVLEWESLYPELYQQAKKLKIGMVLVNSNEAFRNKKDSMEAMKKHAEEKKYPYIPYTVDKNHQLADAFGAKTTPHVFLFDQNLVLQYRGAIDNRFDDKKNRKASKHYLKNAMEQLANKKEISLPTTKSLGCSIKRI